MAKNRVTIEFPSRGATYCEEVYGVYSYGIYPRHSVLAGQQSRQFLGAYDTLEEAKREHPEAKVAEGCGFNPPSLNHLPDDGE